MTKWPAILLLLLFPAMAALADGFSYEAIAERYGDTRLDARQVREAKMQGECLVGLKELNFQKRHDFDPVAEWTNFRVISLLEHLKPCTVLIMIEVARSELVRDEGNE